MRKLSVAPLSLIFLLTSIIVLRYLSSSFSVKTTPLFWIEQDSVWPWFYSECASFLMDENVVLFVKLVVKVVYGKEMVFVSSI